MKILLLSDSNSPHTLRWAKSIRNLKHSVGIFSLHKPDTTLYNDTPDIKIFSIDAPRELQTKDESTFSKLIYLRAIKKVRKVIKEFKPDLVHSHYASSYGLVGALSGFHPYIISLWGGDVFSFPNFSILHKKIVQYNLSKADKILSTSKIMKEETKRYTDKEILVTPFGIDTGKFSPRKVNSFFKETDLVIGTIKTLENRYGIEYLIKSFSLIKKKFPEKSLKLLIVGEGTQRNYLQTMIKELDLERDTKFTGYINHDSVQDFHNMLDIYVAMSLEESFGVAVLEASASGKPVVVSNVGGLPEVVENEKSGFIVESKNSDALAEALVKLIQSPELRISMGNYGRNKVLKEYEWNDCVSDMENIYKTTVT